MTYDASGIQQEGRFLHFGEEEACSTEQRSQSESRTFGRQTSWKYRSTCENCKSEFPGRKGAANRFCQNSCQHEWVVNRWLPCSICMAEIGIGSKTAARLLGENPSSIAVGWKKRGIVAKRPEGKSWFQVIRIKITAERNEQEKAWRLYQSAWMDEIKTHNTVFLDWGYEWTKEKARRKSAVRYAQMSDEEKKNHHLRTLENRHKRWEIAPETRLRDRAKTKLWETQNPDRKRAYIRKSTAKRKIIDPGFRVQCNMRNRLKDFIGSARDGGTKSIRALIGCSTIQLAQHLEAGFTKRMRWDNYGTYWHVDHILPCASFDHTDAKQVAQCWHWTNLRPLEASKNMEKSDTITEPQMQLLLCATH